MPVYEYQCSGCKAIMSRYFKMTEKPGTVACPDCGAPAGFILSCPMIQISTVRDVPWLRDFARTRKEARFGHKPIETRQEYHKYLETHDLRPCDGENLSEV